MIIEVYGSPNVPQAKGLWGITSDMLSFLRKDAFRCSPEYTIYAPGFNLDLTTSMHVALTVCFNWKQRFYVNNKKLARLNKTCY